MARARKYPDRCKHRDQPTTEKPKPHRCRAHKDVDDTGFCPKHKKLHKPPSRDDDASLPNRKAVALKNVRNGIYAKGYTEDEMAFFEDSDDSILSSLDEDIIQLRIQLRRVTEHLRMEHEDPEYNPMRTVMEEQEQRAVRFDADGNVIEPARTHMTRRRHSRDFELFYLRLTTQLRNLVATRHDILNQRSPLEDDPQAAVRAIQGALSEARARTGIDPGMGLYQGNGHSDLSGNGHA